MESEDGVRVALPVFEGPLDLLLYLIRKDEVDIYDIPIEQITREYLQYLEMMKMLNLDVAGEFLVMAATLMYIKSRTLLPADQQPPEEEAEEDDPRWELVRQLVEYKKFKDAAFQLHLMEERRSGVFGRGGPEPEFEEPALAALGEIGIFDLITAFQRVLDKVNKQEDLREIFEERHTVSDKIRLLTELFAGRERMRFTELFEGAASRTEVVVTFLAMLELIRLKRLRVVQAEAFGEIDILRAGPEEEGAEPAEAEELAAAPPAEEGA